MRTLEQTDTISAKDRELLATVKDIIRSFLPEATVLLYGSVARGTQDRESDYDILILTDTPPSKEQYTAVEDRIFALEIDREVILSTIYHTWDEWDTPIVRGSPFYKEVTRDAIAL